PKSIAILGAGAIGAEFAYFLNAFGSKVTLIEMLPNVVPIEDEEISLTLKKAFEKQGITIHTGTTADNVKVSEKSVKMDLESNGSKTAFEADTLLIAIGLIANTEGLLSDIVKLEM